MDITKKNAFFDVVYDRDEVLAKMNIGAGYIESKKETLTSVSELIEKIKSSGEIGKEQMLELLLTLKKQIHNEIANAGEIVHGYENQKKSFNIALEDSLYDLLDDDQMGK